MFGTLRFALASLVAFSHLGGTVFGRNPGVFAVVIFFIISGFVVQQILASGCSTRAFAAERALRIAPAYLVVLLLTILAMPWLETRSIHFLSHAPEWRDWAANLAIIPLNFFMWSGQDRFTLIPPAWSLGLELQFYLLAPVLLMAPRVWRVTIAMLSLVVWVAAGLLLINPDWWGYRLLPGTLVFFLAGGELARGENPAKSPIIGLCLISACLFLTGFAGGWLAIRPFNLETALGLATGLTLVAGLRAQQRRAWDDRLGAIAYPLFLVHFLMIWIFGAFGISPEKIVTNMAQFLLWALGTLAIASIIHYAVEAPLAHWRRTLRGQQGKKNSKKGIQ